ncbi:ABC transporter permease [Kineosporia sp. R_H_3]|uniref:ABC transporter permease n=1 Tax=Kineosporia sp. R_H_3 TaxID=1961848 RepID=UPI001E5BEEDE|nr:ABC-2 family transporter protein [Kineosporia sp. R_H_3]
MADTGVAAAPAAVRRDRWRPYRAVIGSRVRSQRAYRASFRMDLFSTGVIGLVELAEVLVLYRTVDALGGLDLHQILLVFGLADFAFSLASVVVGHVDELPKFIRSGTLDVFFLRPQPVLLQVVTSELSLRRLSRAVVGLAAFCVGLVTADVPATPRTAVLLSLALVSATAISAAQYVTAGGLQFFLVNGHEMTNAFVYGGRYAATQPAAVWSAPVRAVFGYVFPMAFCGYLPVLAVLGMPGPPGLPAWLAWCTPVAALWAWCAAMLCWRWGTRSYQGAGG